jgi:hypothetical protein
MNYTEALKMLWQRSKVSYLILLVSLIKLLPLAKLKLGSNVLAYVRERLEDKAVTKYEPTKEEFDELAWFATYAIKIFQYDNATVLKAEYPMFTNHVVDEYRTCRYTLLRQGNNVYISVRGSTTQDNWIDGLTSELTYSDELGAKVHMGYDEVARGIADAISLSYLRLDDNVYITGGSMGGAVSTMLGWYLKTRGFNLVKVWAFANPRVSEDDYGDLPVVNVLNLQDPVVYLPSFSLFTRYRHQGIRLCYSQGEWKWYEDSWRTDLLTSALFITDGIKLEEHLTYANRFMELRDKLGY